VPFFFTLPEFFWNVPWREVDSEEELQELTTAYLNEVPQYVQSLMSDLPTEQYGKIVLLAGSCATLIKVGEGGDSYYDVINYLLSITNHNYKASGTPLMSMWPKRYVSGIDFGVNVGFVDGYWLFQLSDEVAVKVKDKSSVVAEHSYWENYGEAFVNSIVPNCPYSINMCLDYYALKENERDKELELSGAKIDFLIACGMSLDADKLHPTSLQFAVRNDGMGRGECEVVKLEAGLIVDDVVSVLVDDTIYLAAVQLY
jgi:hypothetical protein